MSTPASQKNIAIFIFDDVEVLDFAGPFEVFSMAGRHEDNPLFNVYTVSWDGQTIRARNGLSVTPTYSIADMPPPHLLLIPGGNGTRAIYDRDDIQQWIRDQHEAVDLLLSVCTGSLVLAKAGVLAHQAATTYHTAFERLQAFEPTLTPRPGERWVDNGKIVTSAGVSAGIDMALHVVSRLYGPEMADKTARNMEYEYWPPRDE